METSFPKLVLRAVPLFQTTSISWHSSLHGAIMATAHTVSCHISSIVSFRKSRRVGFCMLWRHERTTCSQTTPHLHQSRRSISRWGLSCMQRHYLKNEFLSIARCFLEELTCTVLSTVAARSKLNQGVSCFYPERFVRGDDHSAFCLLGQLLDRLIACEWEKGSNIEARNTVFQFFVQHQRQLECHASRKHSDISNVLSYLFHQSGFAAASIYTG